MSGEFLSARKVLEIIGEARTSEQHVRRELRAGETAGHMAVQELSILVELFSLLASSDATDVAQIITLWSRLEIGLSRKLQDELGVEVNPDGIKIKNVSSNDFEPISQGLLLSSIESPR